MTREEAIKAIKSHCYFANLVPVGKEALDMAIEALEAKLCEDAISREAVLAMSEYIGESATLENPYAKPEEVARVKDILALPPVTPARKKGKWVDIGKDGSRIYRCRCSECGKNPIEYTYGYEDWWFEELPKFCPDCGTEMESEE